MHPATPLIPAIWSSSKHAGDVKIPHLDVGEQQTPESKWMGWGEWRRVKNGGVWQRGAWGQRKVVAVVGVGSGMCHPHILAALLLINFSHDQLWSQYIKHEEGGGDACTSYHPCCHLTPLSLLRGNVNSFSNLFTSPLVATALCFWWRAAKNVSFSTLAFPFLAECGYETLHLRSHPISLAVISLSKRI